VSDRPGPCAVFIPLVTPYQLRSECSDDVVGEGVGALQSHHNVSIHGLTAARPVLGTLDLEKQSNVCGTLTILNGSSAFITRLYPADTSELEIRIGFWFIARNKDWVLVGNSVLAW
jgi:hypothetical protein